jgi:uncharacterized protein with PIN domain
MSHEDHPLAAPRLLIDAMLGKLARWLRLMGFDATYLPDVDDIVLVRHARAEGRLLVTRDRGLAARRGVEALLIDSQDLEGQLNEVLSALGAPPPDAIPRCTLCNEPLEELPHDAAEGRVPPYVWRTQETFSQCPVCRRVYWPGTHWEAIQEQVTRWRARQH